MPDNPNSSPALVVGPDEKTASIMAYLPDAIVWGEVVVKSQIRVSTWLRTNVAPEKLYLHNARFISLAPGALGRPVVFSELHLTASQILAYHILPPAQEPFDFDPTEPNRVMEPVTALFGPFRANASLRLSSISSLAKYIESAREAFTPLYEVEITCPLIPELKVKSNFCLTRQITTLFGKTG